MSLLMSQEKELPPFPIASDRDPGSYTPGERIKIIEWQIAVFDKDIHFLPEFKPLNTFLNGNGFDDGKPRITPERAIFIAEDDTISLSDACAYIENVKYWRFNEEEKTTELFFCRSSMRWLTVYLESQTRYDFTGPRHCVNKADIQIADLRDLFTKNRWDLGFSVSRKLFALWKEALETRRRHLARFEKKFTHQEIELSNRGIVAMNGGY